MNSYHIFKDRDKWNVKKTGAIRSLKTATKSQAIASAKSMLKKKGGGEIIIHDLGCKVVKRTMV